MDGGSTPPASTILGNNMKENDRIKIYNWNHTQYHKGTVVEIYEDSVKYKHDSIGGHFIVLKKHVEKFCESCECDPCDCDWGN